MGLGLNPKALFKILRAAGVRIRFDGQRSVMIIETDQSRQEYTFAEIERLVNGE